MMNDLPEIEPTTSDENAAAPEVEATETVVVEEVVKAPKAPEPAEKREPTSAPDDGHWWWGTGRRKAAVARVRIRPGNGDFIVNSKPYTEFFAEERDHQDLATLLKRTNTEGSLNIHVNVNGGGYTGQAGAILLGLGRALLKYDTSLDSILREHGYLSRDPRRVERKKPGQPGARRRFQFSKR